MSLENKSPDSRGIIGLVLKSTNFMPIGIGRVTLPTDELAIAASVNSLVNIASQSIVYNVLDFPGNTLFDKAIAAIAAAKTGGGGTVLFPPGIYSIPAGGGLVMDGSTNVTLSGYGATLTMAAGALYAVQFSGSSCTNPSILGFIINGDGATDSTAVGMALNLGLVTQGAVFADLKISGTERGLYIEGFTDFVVSNVRATNIGSSGGASAHGLGIAFSGCSRFVTYKCFTDLTQRHGIYTSACSDVAHYSSYVKRNRTQNASLGDEYGGIEIARSSRVTVYAPTCDSCWHGAICVESDESNVGNSCIGISIVNPEIVNSRDQDIQIGGPSGGVGVSLLAGVNVIGGCLQRLSSNNVESIRIRHGNGILIDGVNIRAANAYAGTTYAAIIIGDSTGISSTFIDHTLITNCYGEVTAGAGGSAVFVTMNKDVVATQSDIRIVNNPMSLSGGIGQYVTAWGQPGFPRTSTTVLIDGNGPREVAIAYSTTISWDPNQNDARTVSVTPNNGAGFTINNPGGPNGNGTYAGCRVDYRIINASGGACGAITFGANIRTAGSWPVGGAGSPGNGKEQRIGLEADASGLVWHEVYRTAADVTT